MSHRRMKILAGIQIEQIKELSDKKIQLLIVSPNEAQKLTPVIEEVYKKGIPVIIVDRLINSENFTTYVGAKNSDIGFEAGKYACELLNGKGNILEVTGSKSSSPAIERKDGFKKALQSFSQIKINHEIEGKWQSKYLFEKQDSISNLLRDIDLVFAHNDVMAEAVRKIALKNNIIDLHIIGIDGLPTTNGGIEMVLNNTIQASFLYPTGGDKTIELAIKIINNIPVPKYNYLETFRIDKKNAKALYLQANKLNEQKNKIKKQSAKIKTLDTLVEKQNTFILLNLSILFLLIIIIGLIYFVLKNKNKTNILLNKKNKTIAKQNIKILTQRDNLFHLTKIAEESTETKNTFISTILKRLNDIRTNPTEIILYRSTL